MSLDTQNDILLALAGLYPDGYGGFPPGADTPQTYGEYAAMALTEGWTRHTAEELVEGRALYEARKAAASALRASRTSLNVYWESRPDYITGPLGALYAAAQKHLDDGKAARAYELVKHAPMPTTYNETQAAAAEEVRAVLLAALAPLLPTQPS